MKQNKPYVVGLTGGIASGKTSVANALRERGVTVLDADAISRSVTAPGGEALPRVREVFGDQVFDGDILNRRRLGDVVFSDAARRKELEEIIHPLVIGKMQRLTDEAKADIVFWDVPLLYETGMDAQCDEVWCVHVPEKEQVRRVMKRDHMSREQALSRMASQMPVAEKKARAQHLIDTSGSFRATRRRVRGLMRDLQRRLQLV
ncbi:MAG: dephospho-CoA kinase [Clostridia bacterium]|nr:dephospho-CoA kinase [Clostridia bacterium]MBR3874585.1 dephospho-CoA kinase [Clostridia bacterium]MBR6787019.1 dephospho-CoA kinase [Clostridia bacterium]